MGLYSIRWKSSAKKELKKLEKKAIASIIKQVEVLSENPRPSGCRKLQGAEHFYRVKTGNYRVIYSIEDDILVIEIIRVGHRREIYRRAL